MSQTMMPVDPSFHQREAVKGFGFPMNNQPPENCLPPANGIVGNSAALEHALRQAQIVAPTDSTVVIFGETGTGKELFGRMIHSLSARRSGPFVSFNCAAIPEGLLESEFFGHEKGAFTNAIAQRTGRFEAANRGTLFLDEIGDIPQVLQPKLLRVLQEQEFERLGSNRTIRTDVRIIAATNKSLSRLVEEGTFRSDLFYRLNVFPIALPPLRERREDVPYLIRHFVKVASDRMQRQIETIPQTFIDAMMNYDWPGNVRELQNLVERAVILAHDGILRVSSLDSAIRVSAAHFSNGSLNDVQREHIRRVLDETNWVLGGVNGAAAQLGIPRTTLICKMRRLGISRDATKHHPARESKGS